MIEKTVTEVEAVRRERGAFVRGSYYNLQHDEEEARVHYPLPKVTVPNVVLAYDLDGERVNFRIVGGHLQELYPQRIDDWESTFSESELQAVSRLLVNPTIEVNG